VVRSVATIARAVPLALYLTTGGAALVLGGAHWHARAMIARDARQFAAGRKDVLDQTRFDSTLVALTTRHRRAAEQATDSARVIIRTVAARVDSEAIAAAVLARRIPPALDAVPEVVALQRAVFRLEVSTHALADSVERLGHAIDTERAAAALSRDMLTAQYRAVNMVRIAQADTIEAQQAALDERPTWGTVRKTAAMSAAVGAAVWKLLEKVVKE
jgi:hypothetical protein